MRHACGIIGFLALTLVAAPATAQDIMQGNVSLERAPTILYMKYLTRVWRRPMPAADGC